MNPLRIAALRSGLGLVLLGVLSVPTEAQSAVATVPQEESLTLEQAITRASANEPAFAAANAERQALRLEQTNARVALLPTATYHNQAVYTEPNGVPASRIGQTTGAPSPIFIANNAVREYASQGVFNETLGLGQVAAIRLADANSARVAAELEIARRGLVSTVVSLFYGMGSGDSKVEIAQRALDEADHFLQITQKREAAGEAAHADVLKAQLQQQQRDRELADAKLAQSKARLELAVLLYPDPGTPFTLASSARLHSPIKQRSKRSRGRTIPSCAARLPPTRSAKPKHTPRAPICFQSWRSTSPTASTPQTLASMGPTAFTILAIP